VPCIPHTLYLGPSSARISRIGVAGGNGPASRPPIRKGSWSTDRGLRCESVFRVADQAEAGMGVERIFRPPIEPCISPYVEIEDEVRVGLLDARG